MNLKDALRSMGRLQSLTIGMVVSNVILAGGVAYAIVSMGNQHDRLVLVPPHLTEEAVVAWNSADKEYLKSFGMYVATLVGNIQPRSSAVILDSVSAFMSPAIYSDFRRQAQAIIDDPVFRTSGAVMSFQPSTIQFEPETSRVFVTGSLITKSSGQDRQKTVTYEMGIQMHEGRPWVTHFTSYEGSVVRTVSWHINNSAREGKPIPQYATPIHMRKPDSSVEAPSAVQAPVNGGVESGNAIDNEQQERAPQ